MLLFWNLKMVKKIFELLLGPQKQLLDKSGIRYDESNAIILLNTLGKRFVPSVKRNLPFYVLYMEETII